MKKFTRFFGVWFVIVLVFVLVFNDNSISTINNMLVATMVWSLTFMPMFVIYLVYDEDFLVYD